MIFTEQIIKTPYKYTPNKGICCPISNDIGCSLFGPTTVFGTVYLVYYLIQSHKWDFISGPSFEVFSVRQTIVHSIIFKQRYRQLKFIRKLLFSRQFHTLD